MNSLSSVRLLAVALLIGACAHRDPARPSAANGGKYYAVSAEEAPFYRFGPQQGNGPDQKLPHNTLVTLVRPSFGYCKVKLMSGEQGFVASEDIAMASPALIASATGSPPADALSTVPKFRLDSSDPRLIPPPEPLPENFPEPTPIPETQPSPGASSTPIVP